MRQFMGQFFKRFKCREATCRGTTNYWTRLTGAQPGSSLFPRELMMGFADTMLRGSRPNLRVLSGGSVGGGLDLFGSEVQVWYGLHELSLGLLQQPVDVLSAVLGQTGPLLLPVPLRCLQERRPGSKHLTRNWLNAEWPLKLQDL